LKISPEVNPETRLAKNEGLHVIRQGNSLSVTSNDLAFSKAVHSESRRNDSKVFEKKRQQKKTKTI
jgi:hypothetical protein